jgi:hypothetical protein
MQDFWRVHYDLVVTVSGGWKRDFVKCFKEQSTWALEPIIDNTRVLVSPQYLCDFCLCTGPRLIQIACGAEATGDHANALSFRLLSKLKSQSCTCDVASYQ